MTDTTNTNTTQAAALAVRDAAAALARRLPLYYGSGEPADEDLAQAIEDLPLPVDTTDWRAEAERLRAERDELAQRNAELAARLAEIEAQETVAWIEHELQGTGLRHLHFERRPNTLRDEVVDPVWTELIARPAPAAAPERADGWKVVPVEPTPELAARLAEIEAQKPVAFFRLSDAEWLAIGRPAIVYKTADGDWREPLYSYPAPAPAAAPERAEPRSGRTGRSADTSEPTDAEWPEGFEQAVQRLPTLADAVALFDGPAQAKPCRCRRCLTERGDLLTLARMIVCPTCGNKRCPHATDHRHACTGSNEPERAEPAGGCGACGDSCWSRGSCRLADESPRPADPRTPPPGCRLLGDYEPAQAGDMAYIGAIGGRWRRVKPRMGIIGATMDELSDGARVLAPARPCRRGPEGFPDRVSCPNGER